MALVLLPEVEEIHSVPGNACLIPKVCTAGPGALDDVLTRRHSDGVFVNVKPHVGAKIVHDPSSYA